MIQVKLYSRNDCHLCEDVIDDLLSLEGEFPHRIEEIDIDKTSKFQRKYASKIPVIEIGPYTLKAPITREELRNAMAAETTRLQNVQAGLRPNYQTASTWSRSDGFTLWLSKHYLGLLNTFFALYVFLPFLAPILMKSGMETSAMMIYKVYGSLCHQLAYRSFFLFGEQAYYPREAARIPGVITFTQATGINEGNDVNDVLGARFFIGSPALGYKVALCERDVAIYGSILLFGLLYSISRRKIPALPWYLWLLLGILPVAVDGLSQIFSQPPLNFFPYRESTPLLRSLTGFLFGLTTAWFGYPILNQAMEDTREMMEDKKRRASQNKAARGSESDIVV